MIGRSKKPTFRLALSYFSIIMVMSLLFSAIIYFITSAQLEQPLPPPHQNQMAQELPQETKERIERRDAETRISILGSLAILNGVVAIAGAGLSYYLARRTLQPIEVAIEKQVQFVSDASHELRTPLTALQTSNEVALRKKKITEEKAREVFQRTIAETEKLRDLADALLNLAKSGESSSTKQTVQLDSFVHEVVARVQPLADKKQISLNIDAPAESVSLHASAVTQILTILLDNAIKYSPEMSHVTVTGEASGRSVKLTVHDEGIGISKKEQAYIFERFYRADAARTRSDTSGHGLGLAIAKELADRHSYSLTCKSSVSKGSVFTLETV